MAVETDRSITSSNARRPLRGLIRAVRGTARKLEAGFPFASLTQRIVFLNLFGFGILLLGILYLNQFRAGLIEAKVESLMTQGEIIASAIAASAAIDTDRVNIGIQPSLGMEQRAQVGSNRPEEGLGSLEFSINPERAAPELRDLIQPTGTRARIYDRDGELLLDSETLYTRGEVLRFDLPPPGGRKPGIIEKYWLLFSKWLWEPDLPLYKDIGGQNGKAYPEVASALTGTPVPIVRANEKGQLVVSVAVPIQRMKAVLGVLLLSTRSGDIDSIVAAERWAIVRVALVAAGVTILLSLLMAHTIAGPVRRLSEAAEHVRRRIKARAEIPDFTDRSDEIGHLSGALRDMTSALYRRIDAIESFAADVAHELKNPLTSLQSAAETLPRVKNKEARQRLVDIIGEDVKRLDRLISDISDASRLDAELSREDAEPIDVTELLQGLVDAFKQSMRASGRTGPRIELNIAGRTGRSKDGYQIVGHDIRLGQVVTNLLDNAVSFSPARGKVVVSARTVGKEVEIAVEDSGPGIPEENLEKIFDRFYTDRPGEESFGQNSGLGLNISRQIITAHGGRIWAENRLDDSAGKGHSPASGRKRRVRGARFVIRLPRTRSGAG